MSVVGDFSSRINSVAPVTGADRPAKVLPGRGMLLATRNVVAEIAGIFFNPGRAASKVVCLSGDGTVVIGAMVLAIRLRFGSLSELATIDNLFMKIAAVTAVLLFSAYYNDLYQDRLARAWTEIAARWVKSILLAGMVLAGLYYLVPELLLGRSVLLIHFSLVVVGLTAWRSLYLWLARRSSMTNVVILGTGAVAQDIAQLLESLQNGYRTLGFVTPDSEAVGQSLAGTTVLGTFDAIPSLSERLGVDTVVVALQDQRGRLPVEALLQCRLAGIRVEEAASFYERLTGQIRVRDLRPSWLIFSQGFDGLRLLRASKRLVDVITASVGLVVTFPLVALSALAIWLESGTPVFYRQTRVGQRGKPFTIIKLRTMRQDAEKLTGPVWASSNGDPRVTWIGRFLRSSRLDELPQLINVLKGEMSLVGPRPERPCFVDELSRVIPYYNERHLVKPGITGLAQVKCDYGSSVEEAELKLRYDMFYIKNFSLLLDLVILLDTAKVVVLGKGAR